MVFKTDPPHLSPVTAVRLHRISAPLPICVFITQSSYIILGLSKGLLFLFNRGSLFFFFFRHSKFLCNTTVRSNNIVHYKRLYRSNFFLRVAEPRVITWFLFRPSIKSIILIFIWKLSFNNIVNSELFELLCAQENAYWIL